MQVTITRKRAVIAAILLIGLLSLSGVMFKRMLHTASLDIFDAAAEGNLRRVQLLVEDFSARLDYSSRNGVTPLMLALNSKNWNIAYYLIDQGADVNAKESSGYTPLIMTAGRGNLELVKYMIDHGAVIQTCDSVGSTALDWAAAGGHLHVVKFFLEYSELQGISFDLQRAVAKAIGNGNLETAQILISSGGQVCTDFRLSRGRTPLHIAANSGHMNSIQFLLENGADINVSCDEGWTALHCSISRSDINITRFLIDNGADINAVDNYGYTPLHIAVLSQNTHIIEQLIEQGVDLPKDISWGNDIEIVQLLIDSGANVNAIDNQGNTPLHAAAVAEKTEMIELLLENGADADIKNNQGETYLCLLASSQQNNPTFTERYANQLEVWGVFGGIFILVILISATIVIGILRVKRQPANLSGK